MTFRFSSLLGACGLAFSLAMLSFVSQIAHADDFAPIAVGDPIYSQLATLSHHKTASKLPRAAASLTRYEAALQTARVVFSVTQDSKAAAALNRENWKALHDLIGELRPELKKMDVDATGALALAERALKAPLVLPASAPKPNRLPLRTTAPETILRPATPGALIAALPPRAGGLWSALETPTSTGKSSRLQFPLSQRLRLETALLAMQRETNDPFGDAAKSSSAALRSTGATASLNYNFNSWLAVRANYGQRDWSRETAAARSPFLSAPLLVGAGAVESGGGALDVQLSPSLRFSTELERLATDVGSSGTRVGGGIGLSAWQNRLSLSANLSRLRPDDTAALPSTAAELNVGVEVRERLTLSLLYQGLFTAQSQNNASRVGGGLSLSF